jgi:hypothetical protein
MRNNTIKRRLLKLKLLLLTWAFRWYLEYGIIMNQINSSLPWAAERGNNRREPFPQPAQPREKQRKTCWHGTWRESINNPSMFVIFHSTIKMTSKLYMIVDSILDYYYNRGVRLRWNAIVGVSRGKSRDRAKVVHRDSTQQFPEFCLVVNFRPIFRIYLAPLRTHVAWYVNSLSYEWSNLITKTERDIWVHTDGIRASLSQTVGARFWRIFVVGSCREKRIFISRFRIPSCTT